MANPGLFEDGDEGPLAGEEVGDARSNNAPRAGYSLAGVALRVYTEYIHSTLDGVYVYTEYMFDNLEGICFF